MRFIALALLSACLVACGCPEGSSTCGNGCIDLEFDPFNCGSCGAVCRPRAAVGTCYAGTCRILKCSVGYADADGDPKNGCEKYVGVSSGP